MPFGVDIPCTRRGMCSIIQSINQSKINWILHCVSLKNWTLCYLSYLCFDSYELHENFQKYVGVLVVANME